MASQFSKKLGYNEDICKWSDGWLGKFRTRFNLRSTKLHGEAADADVEAAESFKSIDIPTIFSTYQPADIFNADETGLFWRCLPDRTYEESTRVRNAKGCKKSKDRFTFLAMVNMLGTEKHGLVIGSSKNPRSFRDKVFPNNLQYASSRKGWMNSYIWNNYFEKLNRKMRAENRKILILVDNFKAHLISSSWSNIDMRFLPPNTTSIIQPCDQGVLKTVKFDYRKRMLRRL